MIKEILAVLAVLILFFLVVIIVDQNRFVIKRYKFITEKTKHPQKWVVLADLHGKEYGLGNEKLLEAIYKEKPTAVFIAGDMLTAKPGKDFKHVLSFLDALQERYPIFYGNGNHEYRLKIYPETYGDMAEKYAEGLGNIGIYPLCNESTRPADENVVIYGLEIDREYYKRGKTIQMDVTYMEEKLGKPDETKLNILLAHNPEYFKSYAAWGADLVFAGHVHGGIMRLPVLGGVIAPSLRIFPRYSGGFYEEKGENGKVSTMILSNGLGSHTIPVRVFNPGQLIVLEIDSE